MYPCHFLHMCYPLNVTMSRCHCHNLHTLTIDIHIINRFLRHYGGRNLEVWEIISKFVV